MIGWAIVMVPWLAKNVADTRNPVYPLAGRVFPGPEWDPGREAKWQAAHGPRPIDLRESWTSLVRLVRPRERKSEWFKVQREREPESVKEPREVEPESFKVPRELFSSVVDVAGRSDWQSPLYLALSPLALFRAGSRRLALWLWAFAAYIFFTWWIATHRLDRFWLPILPALAILAGLGADWARGRSLSILFGIVIAVGLLTNLTYVTTALAGLNEWTGDLVFLRKDIPRRWNAAMARMDAELPSDARPLMVGQAAVFHLNHSVAYNTVFNLETIELLSSGRTPEELAQALHERHLTHVYVDWKEIGRHREPGGYGFTDFVVPARFAEWVAAGVLLPPRGIGQEQELYKVAPPGRLRPRG